MGCVMRFRFIASVACAAGSAAGLGWAVVSGYGPVGLVGVVMVSVGLLWSARILVPPRKRCRLAGPGASRPPAARPANYERTSQP